MLERCDEQRMPMETILRADAQSMLDDLPPKKWTVLSCF